MSVAPTPRLGRAARTFTPVVIAAALAVPMFATADKPADTGKPEKAAHGNGNGHGVTPPGQDPTFTPPGQDPTFTPPGQDPDFTPPGQDPNFTPPGQDPNFTPPGQDPDFAPPGQEDKDKTEKDKDKPENPGHGGTPPGQEKDKDETEKDKDKPENPGHGGTPPGHGGENPGNGNPNPGDNGNHGQPGDKGEKGDKGESSSTTTIVEWSAPSVTEAPVAASQPSTQGLTAKPVVKKRTCVSRRVVRIRLDRYFKIRTARVLVNGKVAKVRRSKKGVIVKVDLRGRKQGVYTVRTAIVTKTGKLRLNTRRFATCSASVKKRG